MTTSLDISRQVNLSSNAIECQDLDASGNMTVAGNLTVTGTLTNTGAAPRILTANAATLAPTAVQSGSTIILSRLAGSTITLPAPVVGLSFDFVVGIVNTSVAYKVITDASTTFLAGGVYIDKALAITRYDADGSTIRSINLNGTTTGGLTVGDYFRLKCITATQWSIEGTLSASGTLATPFATS